MHASKRIRNLADSESDDKAPPKAKTKVHHRRIFNITAGIAESIITDWWGGAV
jgi:hypothetical protein